MPAATTGAGDRRRFEEPRPADTALTCRSNFKPPTSRGLNEKHIVKSHLSEGIAVELSYRVFIDALPLSSGSART